MRNENSNSADRIEQLAERLSSCPQVSRFDGPGHNEAWTLAHALVDIQESLERFKAVAAQLQEGSNGVPEIKDRLLEIGEEFRHVLYHIRDPRFFRYLFEDGESKRD
jgi:hypothetical protein